MYVEILCPRCLAAVAGQALRDRSRRSQPAPVPPEPFSLADEESLTETDIVEAESASGEGGRNG